MELILHAGHVVLPVGLQRCRADGIETKARGQGDDIVSVDDSPNSLEGIKEGKSSLHIVKVSGFRVISRWRFSTLTRRWGCTLTDVITGPIVINASNVDQWIKFVKNIIGEEAYKTDHWWNFGRDCRGR